LYPHLTPRQQAFLDKLKELHQRSHGPVHYTTVARELGVSRFSAYDMLQVLEKKGLAGRQYVRGEKRVGPGRSMVVFYPRDQAASAALSGGQGIDLGEEWQQFQRALLDRLTSGREGGNRLQALSDVLASLRDKSPLEYCAATIGELLLNLQAGMERAAQARLFKALRSLAQSGEIGLGALAGLSLGKSLRNQNDPSLTESALERLQAFQKYLSGLSSEKKSALLDFVQNAVVALDSEQ